MIFNQFVSWHSDWSLSYQANNRFQGRAVKGLSIGILTRPFVGEDVVFQETIEACEVKSGTYNKINDT